MGESRGDSIEAEVGCDGMEGAADVGAEEAGRDVLMG
jgi:hypothetical protein